MKKTLLFLGISVLTFGNSMAQRDDKLVEKLRDMYGEEKYQDCAHDAIKFSSNPKLQGQSRNICLCFHGMFKNFAV